MKKTNVDTVMNRIVTLLIATTFLTIAGIVVVIALPINASLKATCVEAALFAAVIETIVLVFVMNVAINVEFNGIDKKLQELEHSISDFIDYLEGDS